MTSTSATSARNCPVCGSRNSGLSLFCAECGAALNGSSESDTDTSAFESPSAHHDSQNTQAFVPSPSDSGRWQPPEPATSRRQVSAPESSQHPRNPVPVGGAPWQDAHGADALHRTRPDEGIRGFVLGLLATVLIVLILGLYLWTGVIGESTRDTVVGWFDFIGG